MLKLLQNTLAALKVVKDGEGGQSRWAYLTAFHDLQKKDGLHAGNKLRTAPVNWDNQRMKVSIAAQAINASAVNALRFCDKDRKLPQFSGIAPKVSFIQKFDRFFDMAKFKKSLRKKTSRHL